ncbi:MAG: aminopeptidase P family protein, partial [Deltaproteobacteria bacterium]|nr:aminopeptidase P family protein [Deltaproteobacteria bacterium]
LISSAPEKYKSRGTGLPYRQDSDFYYLSGTTQKDLTLLISSTCKHPLLILSKPTPSKILWEGAPENPKKIASAIGAELVFSNDIKTEVKKRLNGVQRLYYQNTPGTCGWEVAHELMMLSSWYRRGYPKEFHHSDALLEPMRLIKTRAEVALIKESIDITHAALTGIMPLMQSGAKEFEIAAALEYYFRACGAEVAFPSIVASGPSAATLHYDKLSRTLSKGSLLLIDCGAQRRMYAADISRVFPIGAKFSDAQKELYQIVLAAQLAAIKKIRPGALIKSVYQKAAYTLTEGLKDLGVLRGRVSTLFEKQAYKPYFPHSIGHSLGLDVHDIGDLRSNDTSVLEEGMVLTVEPGLYFAKKTAKLPACGVRIEDNVLVTATGNEVLSRRIPKAVQDVEAMLDF